jgi:segregation and condensation protein A
VNVSAPQTAAQPAAAPAPAGRPGGFEVHLPVFEGPFDLLLGLIAKHKLDITEIALAQVTDEFIAYIRGHDQDWDLDVASEFLVVAATLLDLKAARLLPAGEVDDEEDLALLEARDLLFARLLQYRAYKQVAAVFAARIAAEGRRYPRAVSLEEPFAQLLPEVLIGIGPEAFAALAVKAMTPKEAPVVSVSHLHAPAVSVKEQVGILVDRLRRVGTTTFRALIADCPDTLTVVARFLGVLELYREAEVSLEQLTAFGELHVRWTGSAEGDVRVTDEFDDAAPAEQEQT